MRPSAQEVVEGVGPMGKAVPTLFATCPLLAKPGQPAHDREGEKSTV